MPQTHDPTSRLRSTTRFGELHHVPVCESTQDLAQGLQGSLVVWAEEQRAGRGRLGRIWHGAPGKDIEATFRIDRIRVAEPAVIAAAVPVAVADALEPHTSTPLRIKWPNDILCGGRKISGILIDASGNPPDTYLVGIGINVNRTVFPNELMETATSVALARGATVERETVLLDVARALESVIAQLERDDLSALELAFGKRLGLVGRQVHVVRSDRVLSGELTDIDLRRAVIDGVHEVQLATVQQLQIIEPG